MKTDEVYQCWDDSGEAPGAPFEVTTYAPGLAAERFVEEQVEHVDRVNGVDIAVRMPGGTVTVYRVHRRVEYNASPNYDRTASLRAEMAAAKVEPPC